MKAAVIVIQKDNKFLAVSRKKQPELFGLVGGKVNAGETPEQAIIREVKEETGLVLNSVIGPIFEDDDVDDNFFTICFLAPPDLDLSTLSSPEGLKVEWLTYLEITRTRTAYPEFNHQAIAAALKLQK
jgi:ADP-ribose pyrophosphatase YjhB (NUDIX family)